MMAALLDHLWQSTLFAVAAGGGTLLFTRHGAATRFWLWLAASLKFLLPFSLLTSAGAFLAARAVPSTAIPDFLPVHVTDMAQPFSFLAPRLMAPVPQDFDVLPLLAVGWALGCAALLGFWFARWMRLRAALDSAEAMDLPAPMPVRVSPMALEPGLVGILRPVLLLPNGITEKLSPEEMHATLAHEICHLERRDNLTAALHMVVEALFWFHPLVWWIGARLIDERERACDEAVVESGTDPEIYADGILKVCRLYLHSPLACAAGVSGADLKTRVEAIMSAPPGLSLDAGRKALLTGAALLTITLPLAAGMMRSPALADAAQEAQNRIDRARLLMDQALPRTAIPYNPADFDKFTGKYQQYYSAFTVHREGTHLLISLTNQTDIEVFPESPTKFFASTMDMQYSFDTDAAGNVTQMVLHGGGIEFRAPRLTQAQGIALEDALRTRYKNQTQDLSRVAPLRRFIESEVAGDPAYDLLTPQLAEFVRRVRPMDARIFEQTGALKSLTFRGVGPAGMDIYLADFEHARQEWRIGMAPDGKINGVNHRPTP